MSGPKPLKPHLVELNILRSISVTFQSWINMYKKLVDREMELTTLFLNSSNFTTKYYYWRKRSRIRKRINVLGKRLDFKSMNKTFDRITSRMDWLLEYDRKLTDERGE